MNIEELYQLQYKLDQTVAANLNMSEEEFNSAECVENRIMATKVEVAELANEVGFFKYWKQSHVMKREATIEEWADVKHFLLSIGNSRGYNLIKEIDYKDWNKVPVKRLFVYLLENKYETVNDWLSAFEQLICIGIKLGFTEEEMIQAYREKRLKNFDRQRNNY